MGLSAISQAPWNTKGRRRRSLDKKAALSVKHMEPGGQQTWVQVPGSQFPSSVT